MTFSTKKVYNSAMLMVRTLKPKKLDNLAMFGAGILNFRRDVGPYQLMTLRAKVMIKLIIWQCLRLEPLNLEEMLVLTSRWQRSR